MLNLTKEQREEIVDELDERIIKQYAIYNDSFKRKSDAEHEGNLIDKEIHLNKCWQAKSIIEELEDFKKWVKKC